MARKFVLNKELKKNPYTLEKVNMDRAGDGPWLILMNHSSLYDVKIVYDILKGKRISPVATAETTAGRDILVKLGGGIVAKRYISEPYLLKDIRHALKKNDSNVLMFPEAGVSFDGTPLLLHKNLGALLKFLNVPVIMMSGNGTFLHAPSFNIPYKRKAPVHIRMECLLTTAEIKEKTKDELSKIIEESFHFDQLKWQVDNNIRITEPTRAEGLERILYKCPGCKSEMNMKSNGTSIKCSQCGKEYDMTELGQMKAVSGTTEFSHIPDWTAWERSCVADEIDKGTYSFDCDGEIGVLRDRKALYHIGSGHLHSDLNGITLTGDEGRLRVFHSPLETYSVSCDYKIYYLGDCICVGDKDTQYYFFTDKSNGVYKVKMAAEEIYKRETYKLRK